ncbi:UIM domain- and EF hand domain-containing protein [Cryptosporidium felis]|nr:UIM domain- and EF hand domain-containing protein [Cryptosporidium felis]
MSFRIPSGLEEDDDLELQRALSESLRECNNGCANQRGVTLAEIQAHLTPQDLVDYSKSVQNELLNILSFNSCKSKEDLDSLVRILQDDVGSYMRLGRDPGVFYDCSKDTELKLLPKESVLALMQVVFGKGNNVLVQESDFRRWMGHNIDFDYSPLYERAGSTVNSECCCNQSILTCEDNFQKMNFCLVQQGGGPCGVLASLNGFIISQLVFNPNRLEEISNGKYREGEDKKTYSLVRYLESIPEVSCWKALVRAICMIIFQSCSESKYCIVQYNGENCRNLKYGPFSSFASGEDYYFVEYENILDVYNFYSRRLESGIFKKPGSLISFVLTVVRSRTLEAVMSDMDDSAAPLIGIFGHCSQELVNLLITGSAVSNVFDGTKTLDFGTLQGTPASLSLKGIQKKSLIGYLTEHEALQYCTVGINYKFPLLPIWVIINKNHYKCSFTFNFKECLPSVSQEFTQVIQKAFQKYDTENSGFIFQSQVEPFLSEISLGDYLLEVEKICENGIVLWNDLRSLILTSVGIEEKGGSQLGETEIKYWVSQYVFDAQKDSGKKMIIATIFPLENYENLLQIYNQCKGLDYKPCPDETDRKSAEELDLIPIVQTRWGSFTKVETQAFNFK